MSIQPSARKFSRFHDKDAQPVEDDTDVYALWDEQNLYLRVICHDSAPERRVALRKQRDESIWSDDSLELFVNRAVAGYDHLAVNSLGVRYEARTEGGMALDRSFNPEWKAQPFQQDGAWGLYITLPFAWVERGPDGSVALSIKRNRPGRTPSGWPDASYHNPSGAGRIALVEKEKPRVLQYDKGQDGAPLLASFIKSGWSAARIKQLEEGASRIALDEADVVTLYYGGGQEFLLGEEFFREDLLPFIERGGMAVIGSSRSVPFGQWLERPELDVQWSGWGISRPRRSVEVSEGEWLHSPNDLSKIFAQEVTPSSGLRPAGEGWKVLATLPMADGEAVPYLMVHRIGKGLLVLTSSNFGYSGGYEIFGDRNTLNGVKLLENLYHHRESF